MNHDADDTAERRLIAAHALLPRLGIRADRHSAEIAARVIDGIADCDTDRVPVLRHHDAAEVGRGLARQWRLLVRDAAPAHDDLIWADLVQFVLRGARALIAEPTPGSVNP